VKVTERVSALKLSWGDWELKALRETLGMGERVGGNGLIDIKGDIEAGDEPEALGLNVPNNLLADNDDETEATNDSVSLDEGDRVGKIDELGE